jgi:putative transposase
LLHAHLVFVTKYRRAVFTDEMPPHVNTMHAVCADLDVELVEFDGKVDHAHLLVHYPPTPAISALIHRLNGRTAYTVRRESTGAHVRARTYGHSGVRPTSPSPAQAHRRRSSSNTSTDSPSP